MFGTDEQSTAQEKDYEEVEEKYIQARSKLSSLIDEKAPITETSTQALPRQSNASFEGQANSASIKLPKIELPTFDGDYLEWIKFKDLFSAIVHNNATLTNAQKLHYLKSVLKGEAEQLLHFIEVSEGNYTESWKILQDRYENERQIINSHFKALFQQPRARTDSASEIKRLLDTTVKHVRALAVLKLPTDHWDHILVYTLSNKLDDETRKQWELKATTTTFPTFNELKQFLEQRYRALEISVSNMWKQRTQQNIGKLSNTLKAHSVTVLSCPVCKEAHHVFYCPAFQKQNVKTRKVTIKNAGLRFNCFKGNHSVKGSSNAASSCITANCNTSEVIITHHASETQQKTVLLATAVVNVIDSFGTKHKARLLLDNGSQSSFVSEAFVQRTRLSQETGKLRVIGLGQTDSGVTKGIVKLQLQSIYDQFSLQINAFVLPKLTSILPAVKVNISD
ncbi:uncharacterized protein LOC111623278 [Centruroides sculpturatus]|uniref:uncharacterized protein LOC111623278 n=1 Tax=Centruroides sculpturatus TaxID=218467 RepID=UPI000C6CE94A|nr:uncharacterized protein LOC111623278 [Centruroides sculpturatus]